MSKIIKVPFGAPDITREEIVAVNEVLKSKILVHGKKVIEFEKKFKNFTKSSNAVAVSSCTAGLHLFYYALGIGKGDEVIVPAQTHLATAHAIELTGAKAVFVDCEVDTGNINLDQIRSKINKKTKAICVVHFLGLPVDIKKLKILAKKYKLYLIEDCALALGAKYYNKHVGTDSDCGVFSFYPVKHITTAEGGMMILKNKKLAERIKLLRAFGVNKNFNQRKLPGIYNCKYLGFNYRMSELHAAIGLQQLNKLPLFLRKRKKFFLKYVELLKDIKEITILQSKKIKNLDSSHYCLSFLLNKNLSRKRFQIIRYLNSNGIGTSIYYPHPVPRIAYYKKKYKYKIDSYINSTKVSDESISISVAPYLKSSDIQYVVKTIKMAIKNYTDK